jgi:hypothetical protein
MGADPLGLNNHGETPVTIAFESQTNSKGRKIYHTLREFCVKKGLIDAKDPGLFSKKASNVSSPMKSEMTSEEDSLSPMATDTPNLGFNLQVNECR